jgi:hypothetical protein
MDMSKIITKREFDRRTRTPFRITKNLSTNSKGYYEFSAVIDFGAAGALMNQKVVADASRQQMVSQLEAAELIEFKHYEIEVK